MECFSNVQWLRIALVVHGLNAKRCGIKEHCVNKNAKDSAIVSGCNMDPICKVQSHLLADSAELLRPNIQPSFELILPSHICGHDSQVVSLSTVLAHLGNNILLFA